MLEAILFTIFVFAGLWGAVGMVVCITLGNLLCFASPNNDHVTVFKTSVCTFAVALVILYVFIL